MRRRVVGLLAAGILLNTAWLLPDLDSAGRWVRAAELALRDYDGCRCSECLKRLGLVTDFIPGINRARATRCRVVQNSGEMLAVTLSSVSVPVFLVAVLVGWAGRINAAGVCRCGYSREGLPEGACCPECGAAEDGAR